MIKKEETQRILMSSRTKSLRRAIVSTLLLSPLAPTPAALAADMPVAPNGHLPEDCPANTKETQTGSEFDDLLFVYQDDNNCLVALQGDDTIKVGGQNDGTTILAGPGNDSIGVGLRARNTQISCGDGHDTVILGKQAAIVWGQ